MKVSIITPAYNSEAFIGETIESVMAQRFQDWELLITDDGSTDNTCEIVKGYAMHDERIRLFVLGSNQGAAMARNHSLSQARGRYIAFCDSDDLWTPDKLEKQIAFMEKNSFPFSFAPYHIISEQGKEIGFSATRPKVNYKDLLRTCDIGCLTAVYDTAFFGKIPMPDIKRRQDYALWLRMLKKTDFAYSFSEPLGSYRLRNHSISRNKLKAIYYIWKVYREEEKLSFLRSAGLLLIYSLHGIMKYRKLKSVQ